MKTRKFKIIAFSNIIEASGYIFNAENRQFALRIDEHCNDLIIVDLNTGSNVLTALRNDLLKPSTKSLIDFAKSYVKTITPEQWNEATERIKTIYPSIQFPVNTHFRIR